MSGLPLDEAKTCDPDNYAKRVVVTTPRGTLTYTGPWPMYDVEDDFAVLLHDRRQQISERSMVRADTMHKESRMGRVDECVVDTSPTFTYLSANEQPLTVE